MNETTLFRRKLSESLSVISLKKSLLTRALMGKLKVSTSISKGQGNRVATDFGLLYITSSKKLSLPDCNFSWIFTKARSSTEYTGIQIKLM